MEDNIKDGIYDSTGDTAKCQMRPGAFESLHATLAQIMLRLFPKIRLV